MSDNVTDLNEHREALARAGYEEGAKALGEAVASIGESLTREGETAVGFMVVMAYLPKGGGHARLPTIMG